MLPNAIFTKALHIAPPCVGGEQVAPRPANGKCLRALSRPVYRQEESNSTFAGCPLHLLSLSTSCPLLVHSLSTSSATQPTNSLLCRPFRSLSAIHPCNFDTRIAESAHSRLLRHFYRHCET